MTLLLVEVGRFVAEAGIWIVALLAVTGLSAAAVLYPVERRLEPRHVGLAVLVGGALAALVHRFGTGLVWAPTVGDRALPVVWAAIGAAGSAAVVILRRRYRDS